MSDAEVIKKYGALVNYIACSRTTQPSDAEDVFQEVFLKYVEKHPKFKNEKHAKAWFIRVTINTATSMYRKHSYAKRESFDEEQMKCQQPKHRTVANDGQILISCRRFCRQRRPDRGRCRHSR